MFNLLRNESNIGIKSKVNELEISNFCALRDQRRGEETVGLLV